MSILDMLPEAYRASIYIDEEAAVRAYLDDVAALAAHARDAAGRLAGWGYPDSRLASRLRNTARAVAPNVKEDT